eukprot:g7317.t1
MTSNNNQGSGKDKKIRLLFQRLREQINQAENEILNLLNTDVDNSEGTDTSEKYVLKKRKL